MALFKKTVRCWLAHDPFTYASAIAYSAVFSMPGLLIVIMAIAGLLFARQEVEDEVLGQVTALLGQEVADSVRRMVDATRLHNRDQWALMIGLATLVLGATRLFGQLQKAFNQIWDVEVRQSTLLSKLFKKRIISFGIVVAIGFLLLVSLAVTTVLSTLRNWMAETAPDYALHLFFYLNIGLSFITVMVLFALVYRILPDAKVAWRDALTGGALSALLFSAGENLMSLYFAHSEPHTTFGAAGSLILLMLWVSYSSMILLFGAAFTRIYGEHRLGRQRQPEAIARGK